jgi:hypothetical protein
VSKLLGVFRGTFLILKWYLVGIIGIELFATVINAIIGAAGVPNNTEVSPGNIITVFLLVMPAVLPTFTFKKLLALGASRKDFYVGSMLTYLFWAIVFSVFNVIWLYIEDHVLEQHKHYLNILTTFGWDTHGVFGAFAAQLAAYMLVIACIHLLCSCVWHQIGIALYVVLAALISISMSIGELRSEVVKGLSVLLFNPNLLNGIAMTVVTIVLLFACGWWFTKRRETAKA